MGEWVVLRIVAGGVFPTVCKIRQLKGAFHACAWSCIPRSANIAVDFVASHFGTEMCNLVWVIRPPSSFVRVLNKDGLPCPPKHSPSSSANLLSATNAAIKHNLTTEPIKILNVIGI
ncbi:hypothetical protein DVH24_010718 [Malus domestica]|uniref:RNase H type-1 domain-containing protein n=1 Tax=Malus domestica TaxID=3750 RepID=A0A498JWQ3_MALDO|nr:hypothetical protein DVH24_010718 [Malus domestica]